MMPASKSNLNGGGGACPGGLSWEVAVMRLFGERFSKKTFN